MLQSTSQLPHHPRALIDPRYQGFLLPMAILLAQERGHVMLKYVVPDWLNVLLRSYTTQIAGFGIIAQFILDFGFSITMPWWVNVGLYAAVIVGRLLPQEVITPTKKPEDDDEPIGI